VCPAFRIQRNGTLGVGKLTAAAREMDTLLLLACLDEDLGGMADAGATNVVVLSSCVISRLRGERGGRLALGRSGDGRTAGESGPVS